MTRNEKILAGMDLQKVVAVEIGALDKPIIPPSAPHVYYVDHTDTQSLRAKYADDPHVIAENLVEVTAVWGEKSLAQALGERVPVDVVVASHVIEHVPDLISWLDELASILKPGGEVRLVVPDRRYTFDVLRAETRVPEVLAAYLVRARQPQPREILDFMTHFVNVEAAQLWANSVDIGSLKPKVTVADAVAVARDAIANATYHDVHCWVFTPRSFAALMHQLAKDGFHRFGCAGYAPTELNHFEFYITLQLCEQPEDAVASWAALEREVTLSPAEEEGAGAATGTAKTAGTKAPADGLALARLNTRLAYLEHSVRELRASRSWRVTAPLRALKDFLRGA